MASPVEKFLSSLIADGRLDPEKASVERLDAAWHHLATFARKEHRGRIDRVVGRVRRALVSDTPVVQSDIRRLQRLDLVTRRTPLAVPPPYESPEQLEESILDIVARYAYPHARIGSLSRNNLVAKPIAGSIGETKPVELPFSARSLARAMNLPDDGSIAIGHVKVAIQAKHDVPDAEFDSAVRKLVDEGRLCEQDGCIRLSDSERRRRLVKRADGESKHSSPRTADEIVAELPPGLSHVSTTDGFALSAGETADDVARLREQHLANPPTQNEIKARIVDTVREHETPFIERAERLGSNARAEVVASARFHPRQGITPEDLCQQLQKTWPGLIRVDACEVPLQPDRNRPTGTEEIDAAIVGLVNEGRLWWDDAAIGVLGVEGAHNVHVLRIEAPSTEPNDASPSGINRSPVRHGEDFRSVHWYGQDYTFTALQAACVKILFEHFEQGTPEVGEVTILNRAGSDRDTKRLDHVFRVGRKSHPAFGTMIIRGSTRGCYRLAAPQTSADPEKHS